MGKEYQFVIEGRLPGLNEYIDESRSNRYKAAQMKKDAQQYVSAFIMRDLRGIRIRRKVTMRYVWIEPNRRRDQDNISGFGRKVILDALVQCGVLQDDGWDEVGGDSNSYGIDNRNPRIIVTMEEIEPCEGNTTHTVQTGAEPLTEGRVRALPAHTTTTGSARTSAAAKNTRGTAAKRTGRARTSCRKQTKRRMR